MLPFPSPYPVYPLPSDKVAQDHLGKLRLHGLRKVVSVDRMRHGVNRSERRRRDEVSAGDSIRSHMGMWNGPSSPRQTRSCGVFEGQSCSIAQSVVVSRRVFSEIEDPLLWRRSAIDTRTE